MTFPTIRTAGKRGKAPTNFMRSRFYARNYLTGLEDLPNPPASFDYASEVEGGFPMALNDHYGDCTIAGFVHLAQLLYASVDETFEYPGDDAVKATYFGLTGGPDTGLQLEQVIHAAMTDGLFGVKIAAFMEIDIRDKDLISRAAYIFGGLYMGFDMPADAEGQFERGLPFYVGPGENPGIGGHCMTGSGTNAQGIDLETWGAQTGCTWEWWRAYGTQAIIVIPQVWVDKGHGALDNINMDTLMADMKIIGNA